MNSKSEHTLDTLRFLFGDPMPVFASLLRSMIVPRKGTVLNVADYNAIEARVLFWVAKHKDGIRAFAENRPLYEEMAQDIYAVQDVKSVTEDQRFVGKQAILGCGYGMGWEKFQAQCKQYRRIIDDELANVTIQAYRRKHNPVVELWGNIERAAIAAVQSPDKRFTINYTTWYVRDDFLWCKLPSGRNIAYHKPQIRYEVPRWGGDKRPKLYYYGVNPRTRKWTLEGTYGGKLVENVVQGIARDIMAEAMLRIEAKGPWAIVLSVHDEVGAERDPFVGGSLAEFIELMEVVPEWAKGCPIKVAGWEGKRYRK